MIHLESITLLLFAGQSNMAGRGCVNDAQRCPIEAGWEYRAVSAPNALHPIQEPFGRMENAPGAIDDGTKKTGSMVSAFAAEYYRLSGQRIVCVSASKGGTSSKEWANVLAADAAARLKSAKAYLKSIGCVPAHTVVLLCQGETDGDHAVHAKTYRSNFESVWKQLRQAGAERLGMIEIGHYNKRQYPQGLYGLTGTQLDAQYDVIRAEQRRIIAEIPDVFFAGSFESYEASMKDEFHYHQSAYNEIGTYAAKQTLLEIEKKCPEASE